MTAVLTCYLEEFDSGKWRVPSEFMVPCDPIDDRKDEGCCPRAFWHGVNSTLVFLLSGQLKDRAAALEPLAIQSLAGLPDDSSPELREHYELHGDTAGSPFWIRVEELWSFDWQQVIPSSGADIHLEQVAALFLDELRSTVADKNIETARVVSWLVW